MSQAQHPSEDDHMSDDAPSAKRQKKDATPEEIIVLWQSRTVDGVIPDAGGLMVAELELQITRGVLGLGPRDTPQERIRMYKVDLPSEELEQLIKDGNLPGEYPELTGGTRKAVAVLNPRRGHVHVFVDYPPPSRPTVFTLFPPLVPSSRAAPAVFARAQITPKGPLFHCNRPTTTSLLPVTLMDPVFGQFVDDFDHHQPTAADYSFALELSTRMRGFFDAETLRAQAFRDVFFEHCQIVLSTAKIEGSEFPTDGHAIVDRYIYLMTECKNELASGGPGEPTIQSGLYYFEYLRRCPLNPSLRWPCLHVVYAGPTVLFCGSTFTDRVHLDVLATVPLFFHKEDERLLTGAARALGALKKAITSLTQYYEKLAPQLRLGLVPAWPESQFPLVNSYRSLADGSSITFRYTSQPTPDKLIFLADAGKTALFIKFVRRYPDDIHCILMKVGIAPGLLGCDKLPGGWIMVVMELKDPKEYRPYVSSSEIEGFRFPPRDALRQPIQDAIHQMHDRDIVHGDLRDVNILVRRAGSATGAPFLICDLDWAGKAGAVSYPFDVSKDFWRPDGVDADKLITKEHDLAMLARIFS